MEKGIEYFENNTGLIGHWSLKSYLGDIIKDEDGIITNELVDTVEGYNLITTAGKGGIMDRLFGLSAVGAMSRIGVGTSNSTAAIGNTTLTGGAYVVYDTVPTRAGLTVTSTATFGTTVANFAWAELGMDNGTFLLNRIAPIGPITKTIELSIIVTVGITQI